MNWENFDIANATIVDARYADGKTKISAAQMMDYLRWMACFRPKDYGALMMAFQERYRTAVAS